MATPSLRHRAVKIDIDNKARLIREQLKNRKEAKQEISPEEHEKRLKMLKELGIVK